MDYTPVGDIIRSHVVNFHVYADDIQMYLEFNPTIPGDAECCLFRLSNCIRDVQSWMLTNKLMLNDSKTEFFIASSPHHMKCLEQLTLSINNISINPVKSVRNLGVTFNSSMSMRDHVTGLCRSINYHIRNISSIESTSTSTTVTLLYVHWYFLVYIIVTPFSPESRNKILIVSKNSKTKLPA